MEGATQRRSYNEFHALLNSLKCSAETTRFEPQRSTHDLARFFREQGLEGDKYRNYIQEERTVVENIP